MSFVTIPLPSRVSPEAHKWLKHKCRRTPRCSWPLRADAATPGDPCSGGHRALRPRRAPAQGRKQAGGLADTRPRFHPTPAPYRRRASDHVSATTGRPQPLQKAKSRHLSLRTVVGARESHASCSARPLAHSVGSGQIAIITSTHPCLGCSPFTPCKTGSSTSASRAQNLLGISCRPRC